MKTEYSGIIYQYHGEWCFGSLCHQAKSMYGIMQNKFVFYKEVIILPVAPQLEELLKITNVFCFLT